MMSTLENWTMVLLSERIFYKIGLTEQTHLNLTMLNGARMLNPLLAHVLKWKTKHYFGPSYDSIAVADGKAFFWSDVLVFESNLDNFDWLSSCTTALLHKMRYTSGQWSINEGIRLVGATRVSRPEVEAVDLRFQDAAGYHFLNYPPVEIKHISDADLLPERTIPVHHALLGNALLALDRRIYRESILYSAMAMESLAASVIENEFMRAMAAGEPFLNVVCVSGKTMDPVYGALMRGTSFKSYLHERALYVLRRSMMLDNKNLYDRALGLYKARNKIVHRGDMDDGEQSKALALDHNGGVQAIDTATEVFHWFGVSPRYGLSRLVVKSSQGIDMQSYLGRDVECDG